MRLGFVISCLLCAVFTQSVAADVVTYNVDLGGIDELGSGLEVRVTGTISVDVDRPVGAAITSSDLSFQLGFDLIDRPSTPNFDYNDNFDAFDLDWEEDNDRLYMTRLTNSPDNNFFGWNQIQSLAAHRFILGAGNQAHRLQRIDGFGNTTHLVTLKSASGPDGPNGFLIGATNAVPESGSVAVLGLMSIAIFFRRHRSLCR
ncbi:MAG: PEP-CTERM sorting domain-containing protein [Planctomycetota bacterium]